MPWKASAMPCVWKLHQFGVQVVLVEPGLSRTGFEAASAEAMAAEGCYAVCGE